MTMGPSARKLFQEFFHIRRFQHFAHGHHLFVDDDGRHGHHAVCRDLRHIGDVFRLDGKTQILHGGYDIFVLFMAGFAPRAQHLDTADALCLSAAAVFRRRRFLSGTAAMAGDVLFFFLFTESE